MTNYNTCAKKLKPPRLPLTFDDVLKHSFLGEFDYLRLAREDARNQRWAQRSVREAIEAQLRIQRAQEECTRVSVEAQRLHSYMEHEQTQLDTLAQTLDLAQPLIACEVRAHGQQQMALNTLNRVWLRKLFMHADFDGYSTTGIPAGPYPVPSASVPSVASTQLPISEDGFGAREGLFFSIDDMDDHEDEDYYAMTEFVCSSVD